MATPIMVNQSTTLVQIDTSVIANAPYIVLLSNVNSPGSLITIRDTYGAASLVNRILVSTTTGVRFLDGGGPLCNLYTINQPYGFLTVTPKTSNIWGVTNTFAFPDSSQVANLNSINVSSINISSVGYIQNALISTASISTICTNNLYITANMSVGQSTIAHAGFFVCSVRTLDDFIASSNIYAGSTISSMFGNITSTLTVPFISTTNVWMNGVLQTASTISTNGPLFVGSSISTTGNLAVGASTFIQGQLTVRQAAFFGSSISTTGALNVGYEAILNSSLQVSHNAFIGGNVSTLSNVTVGASLSVMSTLYTQWNMVTNSSILASGSFSTLQDVNIRRNLSTLGKAFIGQELYTTSSILATGSFSTLQDVNVARNVSVLGNLYVKGTIQFDQTEVDLQDIMASSITAQFNISTMSSFIAFGGLDIRQSTFLGGTVSSMSNFNIFGLLSTASTVVVGDSLIVAKTGFFGSNISTHASMGVGGVLRVGGGAVLQSTLSTFGQAAFFSSVQIQGSLSVMSSIAAACNVFVGNTLSTSNLILYGSTSISTLAVTNTVGFGMNVSSSTLHYGLFSTSGAMNIGGLISTTNALTVGSTIDTYHLAVQRGMSVFSNAGFAQDVSARSSLYVGMSTVLNGGFYTQSPAYMADVQFTSNVVIGNPGGLQTNYGNLSNFGLTMLKGNLTVTTGITTLSNYLQIDNKFGVSKNTISNDTWMSSLTTSSLVVSYYQSTIGNAAFFSNVQIQGNLSVYSTLDVQWNASFTRNLAASTICTNQLTISTLNVIAPSNTSFFVSSSTLHYGLFSSFGQIFTGKEISTMSSISAGGNLNILSNATIGRNLSTLGTVGFGATVNILGTTTGQGTAFFNTNLVTPQIFNSSLQTSSILTSTLTAVNTSASNAFAISSLVQSNLYVPFLYNSSLQTSSIFTSTLTASNIFACNIAISSMMASTINVSTLSTVNLNASSIVAPMGAFSTMSVFSQAVISNVFARAIGVNCNSPQYAVDVAGIVNASYIYQNGAQYVPAISNLAFSSISTNYALIKNTNVPSYFVAVSQAVATNNGGIYSGATPATLAAVTPSPALAGTPTSFTALYYTGSVWYIAASNATNSLLYSTSSTTAWTASTAFTQITPVSGALPSSSIRTIAYNGQYYLLAGTDTSGNVVRTTDFRTFTGSLIGTTRTVRTLVWNNSIWVAGGLDSSGNTGFIAYSTNGTSWTTVTMTLPTTMFTDVFSIIWNGNVFVAMGNDATTNLKYSYDGITWANSTATSPSGLSPNTPNSSLAWSGKHFVAIQFTTTFSAGGKILRSTNGIDWTTSVTQPVCPTSVTWDGVKFVLVCGTGGTPSSVNNIYTSPDGSTWTAGNTSMNCIPNIEFTTNTTPTLDLGNTSFYTNAQPQFQGNQSTNTVTMLSNAIVLNNLYTDNTGRVGINNNAPAYALDVNGTVNATSLLVNGATVNTAGVNSAGNVGINKASSASYNLDVNGTTNLSGSAALGFILNVNGPTRTKNIVFATNSFSPASDDFVNGAPSYGIGFARTGLTGLGSYATATQPPLQIANYYGINFVGGQDLWGAGSSHMAIVDGKVGIQNTNPSCTLDVNGITRLNSNVGICTPGVVGTQLDIRGGHNLTRTSGSNLISFQFYGGGYRHFITSRHNGVASSVYNAIDFWLNNSASETGSSTSGTGNVNIMSVTAIGVGINCNVPQYTLDVNGTVNATSILVNGAALTTNIAGINSSGNVGIGGALNASYNLLVTGTQSNTGTLGVTGAGTFYNNLTNNGRFTNGRFKIYPQTAGGYTIMELSGGNNTGFIYADYTLHNDGIHFSYGYYGSNGVAYGIDYANSRISVGYGTISLNVGWSNSQRPLLSVAPYIVTVIDSFRVSNTLTAQATLNVGLAAPTTNDIIAGSGLNGRADGTGLVATFNTPRSICVDPAGNIYVADFTNFNIRKITPAGVVTTFAGSTAGSSGTVNATGTAARFEGPYTISIDPAGLNLYVVDRANDYAVIRKIVISSAVVSTVLTEGNINLSDAINCCVDSAGNIYFSSNQTSSVRKVVSGTSSSVHVASVAAPRGICLDSSNTYLYVSRQSTSPEIIRIKISDSTQENFVGGIPQSLNDGVGYRAGFISDLRGCGMFIDPGGSYLYVSDYPYLRRIEISTRIVATVYTYLDGIAGICMKSDYSIYASTDVAGGRVYRIYATVEVKDSALKVGGPTNLNGSVYINGNNARFLQCGLMFHPTAVDYDTINGAPSYGIGRVTTSLAGLGPYTVAANQWPLQIANYYGINFIGGNAAWDQNGRSHMCIVDGKVGINCNAPADYYLDVNGQTNINGVLTLKAGVSHKSSDNLNRLYYSANGKTMFGAKDSYEFQDPSGNAFVYLGYDSTGSYISGAANNRGRFNIYTAGTGGSGIDSDSFEIWWYPSLGQGFNKTTSTGGLLLRLKTGSSSALGRASLQLPLACAFINSYWYNSADDATNRLHFELNGSTYFNVPSTKQYIYQVNGANVAYLTSGGTFTNSDKRVKKNITPSKDALPIVNALNFCKFDFIDTLPQSGTRIQHGLIAQEVFEVYPEAVSYSDGYIPTAFSLATQVLKVDSNLQITTSVPHQFTLSDTIELIIDTNRKQLPIVSIISDTEFTVSAWDKYDSSKGVFVFGKKTNYYMNIDKAQIGILAARACQTLSQENTALQAQVASQQSTINAILAKLNI